MEELKRVVAVRGVPESITIDNGSEFAGRAMEAWAYQAGVKLDFIRPGKPVENAFIESFNGKLRDECLNRELSLASLTLGRSSIGGAAIAINSARTALWPNALPRSSPPLTEARPSPSPSWVRQVPSRVKGSLTPGKNRPLLTPEKTCLRNLR